MKANRCLSAVAFAFTLLLATAQLGQAQLLWTVGLDDNGWPQTGTAGGPEANFVQENGAVNPLPGSPFSPSVDLQADNDYYFAGLYSTVIAGNGTYDPVGQLGVNEEAAERALTTDDTEFRYHFNLPANLLPTDKLAVTFDASNFEEGTGDPRRGVTVLVNGVLVQPEVVIRPAQLDNDYTTPAFTLASVNAEVGPGFDNIVTLRGTDYSSDGGGRWMGIDYVKLTQETTVVPVPVFPWWVGSDDNAWTVGNGGGQNATFVAGNGSVNPLPGSPISTETAGGADNDYYFSGIYTNVIAANGAYQPVGLVQNNEEAAERGFAGAENVLRYHFNLPNTMQAGSLVAVAFDALNLDTAAPDPRYGVEVYVNGVLVQPEVLIRPAQLNQPITTATFTLGSVNAQIGLGYDNVITLRGISHSTEGGGDLLGIDYVRFKPMPAPPLPRWSVGKNDNGHPAGDGGGPNASFVQENGTINPLPGSPTSPELNQQADNDYYLAGIYSTVIPANGSYVPVGDVPFNEEAAERAFADTDNDLRYHFNLPSGLSGDTQFTFSFEPISLDGGGGNPHYGAAVYVNNTLVMPEVVVMPENLNKTIFTPAFSLAQVAAQAGPGFDNIVSLRGVNYNAEGGGNWMGFDYVRLDPVLPPTFPLDVQIDNNSHSSGGLGGGPNAVFVQEAGSNPLPGNPASGEVNQQSDDDYYFAGVYSNAIPGVVTMYGDYTPIGTVLVNEYAAERAFAGSDNEKRYHFNLPTTLQPTDQLLVTYDALDLDGSGGSPQYGVELYFNGVQLQAEKIITPADIDVDVMTAPFTLSSVDARTGPGYDNVITLRGINHSAEGGGNWMGIDYLQVSPMPKPVFPVQIGRDDNGWPAGDGGGPNASFVQENGTVNDLPGNPRSVEISQQADNDYYLAGVYSNTITAVGNYLPVGIVPRNEEAAERALTTGNYELRYHFNLPATLTPSSQVAVTFDVLNLDLSAGVTDPRFGVEVYFNNVLVQPQIVVQTNQLDVDFTTPAFTLTSVDGQTGNADNVVTLKGTSYSAEGGGNWMGIDYVRIHAPGDTGQAAQFTSAKVSNGKITLTWTGAGNLEWSPQLIGGTWTPVTPVPTSPYTEDVLLTQQTRFYRLKVQ